VTRIEKAAYNNVLWYEAICQAHGIPREFYPGIWLNRQSVPQFYSNALVFSDVVERIEVERHLQTLIDLKLPNGFSVKDGLARLELTSLGFQLLFEASWIWRAPNLKLKNTVDRIYWTTVQNATALEKWERAWSGQPRNQEAQTRIFLPSLLNDEDIRFIAAYQEEHIIAGVIANRTDDVVGVSNIFAPDDELWADCIAAVTNLFPELPLVGYERGDNLALTKTLGFEELGSLKVWVREGD
jgi:hypothetical protein